MPVLIVKSSSSTQPRKIEFTGEEFKVGRKDDNDLLLYEKNISGNHFRIILTEKGYEIEDMNSSNGTYLNKYLINKKTLLKDRDIIQVGRYRLTFKIDSEEIDTGRRDLGDSDIIERKLEDMDRRLITLKRTPSETIYESTTTLLKLESSIQEAKRAYSRLKALYRSTNMIISHLDLEERLKAILQITINLMECDRGYIMLFETDAKGAQELVIKVSHQIDKRYFEGSPSMSIAKEVIRNGKTKKIDNIMDVPDFKDQKSVIVQNIISAICSPMKFEREIIGVMYVDNISRPYHYSQEDLTIFEILANQTAAIVEDGRLFERYKKEERRRLNFERYFSPQIVSEIMTNEGIMDLGGVRKEVSVIFVDIREFTKLAEESQPQILIDSLNEYFNRMLNIIFQYDGCIDKFYGDGLLAFFGAPIEDKRHAFKGYNAACEMQKQMAEYCEYARKNGLLEFSIGIGLSSGMAIIGNIGSEHHIEYTVIGDTVNVASRLSDDAQAGEILLTESTLNELEKTGISMDSFQCLEEKSIRGRKQAIKIYSVQVCP